jgi:hypothetical protein
LTGASIKLMADTKPNQTKVTTNANGLQAAFFMGSSNLKIRKVESRQD